MHPTPFASGCHCSRRRSSAIARLSAAILRPRRRSATPRRFFSRSTPRFTWPGCQDAGLWLSRLSSPDIARRLWRPARSSRPSTFRSRFPSPSVSTRWPSAGWMTSARWPRQSRSTLGPHGVVRRARFAFGGVAATPIRVAEAEAAVANQVWNDAAVERVQAILERGLTPMSDHRGSKEYRLEVSKSLVEKFQWEQSL